MADGFDDVELERYEDLFNTFCTSPSGKLSPKELEKALRKLGYKYTANEVKEIVREVDKDQDGSIDFKEFLKMIKRNQVFSIEMIQEMRNAWDLFDTNKDGMLTKKELGSLIRVLGQSPTQTEIDDLYDELDTNKDGHIDFWEFATQMTERMSEYWQDSKYKLQQMCRKYDKWGLGLITVSDLRNVLTEACPALNSQEIDAMVAQAHRDEQHKLMYDEWINRMISLLHSH